MEPLLKTFWDQVAEYLFQPFQSWPGFLTAISGGITAFIQLGSKTAWPYLLSSTIIAYAIYVSAKPKGLIPSQLSFRQFAFPREVYWHRSAIVDYKYVAVDFTIKGLIYVPFMSGFGWLLYKALINLLGEQSVQLSPSTVAIILPMVGVILADFGFFVAHYLMHRIPFLWPFHEVHHSAEVLTPITVYRVHPVEDFVNVIIGTCLGALFAACYTPLIRVELDLLSIFGMNFILFFFFTFAFQLRHSHIWLSYGPVLSWLLISPAQHQIHHSVDSKHWNKNFGFIFAIWDAIFGTLYIPRQREVIQYGVPDMDPNDSSSVAKLYFLPFLKSGRVLRSLLLKKRRIVLSASGS